MSEARAIAVYCAIALFSCSYPEVGRLFKRRQSTVWAAADRVRNNNSIRGKAEKILKAERAA